MWGVAMYHALQNKEYTGLELRHYNRRKSPDQRSEIRWEPVKKDRRTRDDRRKLSRGVVPPSVERDND